MLAIANKSGEENATKMWLKHLRPGLNRKHIQEIHTGNNSENAEGYSKKRGMTALKEVSVGRIILPFERVFGIKVIIQVFFSLIQC